MWTIKQTKKTRQQVGHFPNNNNPNIPQNVWVQSWLISAEHVLFVSKVFLAAGQQLSDRKILGEKQSSFPLQALKAKHLVISQQQSAPSTVYFLIPQHEAVTLLLCNKPVCQEGSSKGISDHVLPYQT